jgi:predicted nucleotidyltransferase component of viral defense system
MLQKYMITAEAVRQLANKYQTTEANIRQEYVQHLFLSYFYQKPQTDKIYFKGGTALRFIYKSPRFSEDLDFSASFFDIDPLEEAVVDTLREIEREGIKTEIVEAKKTTGGYLAILLLQIGMEKITIQLEISLRAKNKKGETVMISNDFVPAYTIEGLVKEQLIDEKIQALLFRKKPRDFYDLYFMLRSNLMPVDRRVVLHQALKALKETEINFETELKQFLPKSHWAIIRDFNQTLEREIERFI